MNTKYNIGDKVWVPIYKNYRKCKIFEIAPIRNYFWGDKCLLAYPYELTIETIKMSCKELKYGIKVTASPILKPSASVCTIDAANSCPKILG